MQLWHGTCTILMVLSVSTLRSQQMAPPPSVQGMVVGSFHMSNPGHDVHNLQVDDILQSKPQAEIKAAVGGIAVFHPTKVMTEWPQELATERFTQYAAGTLEPSRNEVVQLGFRLAKESGLHKVYGIDVDGDFPYQAVQTFAESHGQGDIMAQANRQTETMLQHLGGLLKSKGIVAGLRFLNDPERLRHDNDFYRQTLLIGSGAQQPGADLLTAWYRRNFLICANILQNTQPGDRVVVFYGSGHAFLLRQCIAETRLLTRGAERLSPEMIALPYSQPKCHSAALINGIGRFRRRYATKTVRLCRQKSCGFTS